MPSIPSLDRAAMADARSLQDRLTKPRGALGRLESLSVQLCGIAGQCPAPIPEPLGIAVFAGDHGVVAQGVTPWPQEVTGQMVANFAAGGAAISVLARQHRAMLRVVDVGVASDLGNLDGIEHCNVARGTADLSVGQAMTDDQLDAALQVGAEQAVALVSAGSRALATGDMGIGNTTSSAAIISAITGRSAVECTGRGTGVDDATLTLKQSVVGRAVARLGNERDTRTVLRELGGLEIAALAGFMMEAAQLRVPIIVDGVISLAALVAAAQLDGGVVDHVIAGHRSSEPGASVALDHLGLVPVIDLDLRLGEGSGAAIAYPIVVSAARLLAEMATFDGAGVTDKDA